MTWSPRFTQNVMDSFTAFCHERWATHTPGDPLADYEPEALCRSIWPDPESLGEYFLAWMGQDETYEGEDLVGADFEAHLSALLLIVDAYEKDPSILDYHGNATNKWPARTRRVKRLLDFDLYGWHYLDSRSFHQRAEASCIHRAS